MYLVQTKWRIFYDGEGTAGLASSGEGGAGQAGGDAQADSGKSDGDGQKGEFTGENFRDFLPEDLKEHSALAKYTTYEGAMRGLVHAQGLLGKDADATFTLPESTDAEGRRGVLEKLGLPDAADKYTLPEIEGLPENMKGDTDFVKGFKEAAHKLGVLPEQVSGIYSWFMETAKETATSESTALQEDDATQLRNLEAAWGKNGTPAFNERLAAADLAVDKLGGDELRDAINDAGLGQNSHMLKALAKIGQLVSEDGVLKNEDGTGGGPSRFDNHLTPEMAKQKALELQREAMELFGKDQGKARRLNEEAQKFHAIAAAAKA